MNTSEIRKEINWLRASVGDLLRVSNSLGGKGDRAGARAFGMEAIQELELLSLLERHEAEQAVIMGPEEPPVGHHRRIHQL